VVSQQDLKEAQDSNQQLGLETTSITVGTFDLSLILLVSSIVRVSSGSSSAIHQVSLLNDSTNRLVAPGPFSPTNNVTWNLELLGRNYWKQILPKILSRFF
jgi:hypothetical protein